MVYCISYKVQKGTLITYNKTLQTLYWQKKTELQFKAGKNVFLSLLGNVITSLAQIMLLIIKQEFSGGLTELLGAGCGTSSDSHRSEQLHVLAGI